MGNIAKIVRIHCMGTEPPATTVAVRIPPLTGDGFLGNLNQKPPDGFITGLNGAEGAQIDPLTGDFLFSTFGANDRIAVG